jgi:hypothetical protein
VPVDIKTPNLGAGPGVHAMEAYLGRASEGIGGVGLVGSGQKGYWLFGCLIVGGKERRGGVVGRCIRVLGLKGGRVRSRERVWS